MGFEKIFSHHRGDTDAEEVKKGAAAQEKAEADGGEMSAQSEDGAEQASAQIAQTEERTEESGTQEAAADANEEAAENAVLATALAEAAGGADGRDAEKADLVDHSRFPSDSATYLLWEQWCTAAQKSVPLNFRQQYCGSRTAEESPLTSAEKIMEKQRMLGLINAQAAKISSAARAMQDGSCKAVNSIVTFFAPTSKLVAWLYIFPPMNGGEDITVEKLESTLVSNGIKFGIDHDLIKTAVAEKRYFQLLPAALGVAPQPGTDGSVEECYPREKAPEYTVDEKGNMDFRSLNMVQQVAQGDVICKISLPIPGTEGTSVKGDTLKPPTPAPPQVPNGTNTGISDDGLTLFARMDGQLVFESGRFCVRPALNIKGNVDGSVGNIDFRGDVMIGGDVHESFVVRATGSVTVNGLVESAQIYAGGDITVAKGVIGNSTTLLEAGKSVKCKFIENSLVRAEDCVTAESIINSRIYCDNAISVLCGRGAIIGGELMAANLIEAKSIGSESNRPTTLTVGALPNIVAERKEIQEKMEKVGKELLEIDRSLRYMETQGELVENPEEKISKLRLRQKVLALQQGKMEKRREQILEISNSVDAKCSRIVCDTLYPMTKIVISGASRVTEIADHRCCASLRDGEIFIGPA